MNLVPVMVELKTSPVVEFAWKTYLQKNYFQSSSFLYDPNRENEYRQSITLEQTQLIGDLHKQGVSFIEGYRCTDVINSIALEIKGNNLVKLISNPSIKSIFDDRGIFYPNRVIAIETTGAKKAWNRASPLNNITGKGVVVGVLDTGLDKTHMNSGEFKGRVIIGYDFADGDSDFDDTAIGHGTHVAGIIGGKGSDEAKLGMAYDVKYRIYKVFSTSGGGGKGIGEAIDKSVQEKCNVINMSLGSEGSPDVTASNNPYYGNIIKNAVKAGTTVVASAGNSGSRGRFQPFPAGSPGIVEDAFCVAAANDRPNVTFSVKTEKDNAVKFIALNEAGGTPPFDSSYNDLEVVLCGYGKPEEFEQDVTGKIALIERGPKEDKENKITPLKFKEKMENAMTKGAKAVLLYNHTPNEMISPSISVDGLIGNEKLIPVTMMSNADGLWMKSILSDAYQVEFTKKNWETVASFSSMGPTPDGYFKPEIIAPGTNLMSTYLNGRYIPMSGTSMSSPAVTGLVALLKQAYPKWDTDQIKSALMNTAELLINPDNNLPVSFLLQGAGEARIDRALVTPALIFPRALIIQKDIMQPGSIKSNEAVSFTLESNSSKVETFPLQYKIFGFPNENNHIELTFDKESIVVPTNKKVTFSVQFTVDWNSLTKNSYEGIIEVGKDLHIPFVIFKNSVLKVPDVVSGISIEPKEVNLAKENQDEDIKINFSINSGSELPNEEDTSNPNYSNYATVELFITDEFGNAWEKIATFQNYLIGDYEFHWNGKTSDGKYFLPKGKYYIQFRALGTAATPDFISKLAETSNFTVSESSAPDPLPVLFSCNKIITMNDIFKVYLILPDIKDCTGIELDLSYDAARLMGIAIIEPGFLSSDGSQVIFDQKMDDFKGLIHVKMIRNDKAGISGKNEKIIEIDFKAIGDGSLKFVLQSSKLFFTDQTVGRLLPVYPETRISKTSDYLLADINEDKVVDRYDWVLFMDAFSAKINEPNYQSSCDFNQDQVVNVEDFIILSQEYGKAILD